MSEAKKQPNKDAKKLVALEGQVALLNKQVSEIKSVLKDIEKARALHEANGMASSILNRLEQGKEHWDAI